jgi:hypothetical protein
MPSHDKKVFLSEDNRTKHSIPFHSIPFDQKYQVPYTIMTTIILGKVARCYRGAIVSLAPVFLLLLLLLLVASPPALALGVNLQSPSPPPVKGKLLILGLGRVGLQCGLVALDHFDQVVGTVRTTTTTTTTPTSNHHPQDDDADDDIERRIERIPFEIESIQAQLKDSTHVLWTIPLPRKKNNKTNKEGQDSSSQESGESSSVLQQVLQEVVSTRRQADANNNNNNNSSPPSLWTGFLSTTGVYGNHYGEWVTEDSECFCTGNARSYLAVEPKFQYVFRCAGIYDSTRSALHTLYKEGNVKTTNNDSTKNTTTTTTTTTNVTNRIHSLDIAKAVVAAMLMTSLSSSSSSSRIYNLADQHPATRNEVFDYGSTLFASAGIPIPSSSSTTDAPTGRARRRQFERKLVSNRRMRDELLSEPEMTYPTYEEGLQAILKDPDTPWNKINK